MKKMIVFCILAALLLSGKQPVPSAAYYSSINLGPVLIYQQWKNLDTAYFTDIRNGVVTLSGDTWTPAYTGLINVSGTCNLKRAPGIWALNLIVSGQPYQLINTDKLFESFSVAVPSGPMQIAAYQENTAAANAIKCTILFEAVK